MGEFEQIPEIKERIERSKMELQENGYYWSPEWDSQSCADQDFVNNFKKGWLYQQSKIEQLEKEISTFKERIEHAEKFLNQIPCQSTWEAETRTDAMKALRKGKRFKEPKKLPHTHIFISNTCECGWTIDQEKALRGES